MNHTMVAGHLGADPEVRFTKDGKKVTTLRVACNSRRGGQEETIWWRLTIWDDKFEKMMNYLKKGSAIIAFGEMQKPQVYNDRNGSPQVSLDLTVHQLSFPPFGKSQSEGGSSQGMQQETPASNAYAQAAAAPTYGSAPEPQNFSDDEIPF
ncbi:MAG: single-stranded DNA-binding protein [Chlamydiia bacterium]|nr:single-stranded DNA-binding protein [Chlamydiia bacterium]MCP5508866.1 single-stranded DNA-binding protein [Chlamydiales bacterium]